MSVYATGITTDVDLARPGKRTGRLHLPHSVTRSAYGVIPVPVAVISGGEGPTVLMMAGNHGDEYEGQIALGNLIRTMDAAEVRGRLIVLPSVNLPAARSGVRVSPLDDGNLNRTFPPRPELGPTHEIAAYLEDVLMPMADVFVDLHSGGSSLAYLPFVATSLSGDVETDRRALQLMRAFGGPYGQIWHAGEGSRTASGAAVRHGCIDIGGEFGGSGVVDPDHLNLVECGIRNLLAEIGVLPSHDGGTTPGMRLMTSDPPDLYAFAPDYGVFVPEVRLGDEVDAGAPVGSIHNLEHPEREPQQVRFRAPGLVICLRAIGRVEPGDCLAHQAIDIELPESLLS